MDPATTSTSTTAIDKKNADFRKNMFAAQRRRNDT